MGQIAAGSNAQRPARLRKQDAGMWVPWRKGPEDLILECSGNIVSRLAYAAYLNWPLPRGRRHLLWAAGHVPGLSRHIRSAPFRSRFGGSVQLDMTTAQFHYLSGLFPSEPHELSLMARLVQPGDTFVDVGTNIGLYLVHLAGLLGPDGFYMALEPDPENFRFLTQAYARNPNVELLDIAVSDKAGVAHLSRKNSLEGTLEPLAGVIDTVEVRTRRLDELIASAGRHSPLVIKIDVEGHEPAVIRGMSGLAESGTLPIMQIEYLPTHAGEHRRLIDQALRDAFGNRLSYYGIENGARLLFPMELGQSVDDNVLNILAIPPSIKARMDEIFE